MALPVIVVGAGIGGLAAAIDLARSGVEVMLIEPSGEVGGKARAVNVAGKRIDVGPTVLTMRWAFDELLGQPLERVVKLRPLDRIARHAFFDGSVLDLFSDLERSADAIGDFAGASAAQSYRRFAAYSQKIAETVEQPFLRAQRPTVASLLLGAHRLGIGALGRIDAHRTMWGALGSFFDDPRLRALFARYATYVGSSPLEVAATFNLIAHVEREGVVAIEGGISQLALVLSEHARGLGVTIALGARATAIRVTNRRASGVELTHRDGTQEIKQARAIVLNADVATIAAGSFGAAAARSVDAPSERSLSAMTWAIAGSADGFALDHHNVFFSRDYEQETRTLWNERVFPNDPTVYVCAPDRDRFFLIANAPSLDPGAALDETEIARCERNVFSRLKRAGLNLDVEASVRMTPQGFARLAPGTGGAIYGEAAHGSLASMRRPGARTRLHGLYVAGGSVHPGPGVPMAALSGRLAAEAIRGDLASTVWSRSADIAGSISTR